VCPTRTRATSLQAKTMKDDFAMNTKRPTLVPIASNCSHQDRTSKLVVRRCSIAHRQPRVALSPVPTGRTLISRGLHKSPAHLRKIFQSFPPPFTIKFTLFTLTLTAKSAGNPCGSAASKRTVTIPKNARFTLHQEHDLRSGNRFQHQFGPPAPNVRTSRRFSFMLDPNGRSL
jgi:hypothetical protein